MTKQEILDKVKTIAVEVAGRGGRDLAADSIKTDSRFIEDLSFSSIAILELVMAIEDHFDLDEVPESDIEKMRTVDDAVEYLLKVL